MDTTDERKKMDLKYTYKVEKKIDVLYPTMEVLTGFKLGKLLSFLETMKESIELLGK